MFWGSKAHSDPHGLALAFCVPAAINIYTCYDPPCYARMHSGQGFIKANGLQLASCLCDCLFADSLESLK